MDDLLTLAREHDLPPKWDGLAVLWHGWESVPPTTMTRFHSTHRDVCEGCGMPTTERGAPCWSANRGLVAVSAVLTHDDLRYEEENRERLRGLAHKRKPRAFWRLHAFRCHHCKLDTVWDVDTDEMWTLDHTDYGDEGST